VTSRLEDAVELLDRSLAYTRVVLAEVTAADLARPTPCTRWRLADLLDHMADSLDAFTDAATGVVPVRPAGLPLGAPRALGAPRDPTASGALAASGASGASDASARVAGLQQQACALLAAWSASPPAPGPVTVGDATIGGPLLVATAALEITVHGWDVARARGTDAPVPEDLARRLLEVAHVVVGEADRGRRFAHARPAPGPSYAERLPAFLGRG
jgi:uncharacterized protein (TIGR03083 family)